MIEDLTGAFTVDDPHDIWLLQLASAAQANALVTGDKRAGLLARAKVGEARIVTAAAFGQDFIRDEH